LMCEIRLLYCSLLIWEKEARRRTRASSFCIFAFIYE
jgi:hypothetical protein